MGQWIGSITGHFKRQEIGDKESVPRPRGCTFLVVRPLRRRTKQQSIKTKLEDPYGGFLQSNQGHQSSQQSEGRKEDKRTERWTRGASLPCPGIPRGVEAGNQPLSPRVRTLETKNHPSIHPFIPFVIFQHPLPFLELLLFASWCWSALLRNHLGRGLSLKVLDNLSLVHRTLPRISFFFFF